MRINGPEMRECPPEFQDRLTRRFGVNQFGDPYFKLMWSQSQFIRTISLKENKDACYREEYQAGRSPGWLIMRWMPPSHYGSPRSYYARTHDPVTGLYFVGEYPWKGRYEVFQMLNSKEVVNGRLNVTFFPLSHYIIDTIIPILLETLYLSVEEKKAAAEFAKQEEEKRRTAEVAEAMMANLPTWMNPVSYNNQGCRTSLIDRKMHQIQKVWDRWAKAARGRPEFVKGIQQGERPHLVN